MTPHGSLLIETITSPDSTIRDRSIWKLISGASTHEILGAAEDLERFRQSAENLYERVRASMMLSAIYRYSIQESPEVADTGLLPYSGFLDLMERRFEEAISAFRRAMSSQGP